ncbi:MAG: RSP_7527 family protein [Oceanobacter sp.]
MTTTTNELSKVATYRVDADDIEKRIQEAHEMRSQYISAALSDLFGKVKTVMHIGSHKVANSH